mmetsp:Transcript_36989/g.87879  ORF Transcript_36989/g.87879 Transcript_36989/m.87879 type:complete len:520 (-) Transcript_36989:1018-2577(-)
MSTAAGTATARMKDQLTAGAGAGAVSASLARVSLAGEKPPDCAPSGLGEGPAERVCGGVSASGRAVEGSDAPGALSTGGADVGAGSGAEGVGDVGDGGSVGAAVCWAGGEVLGGAVASAGTCVSGEGGGVRLEVGEGEPALEGSAAPVGVPVSAWVGVGTEEGAADVGSAGGAGVAVLSGRPPPSVGVGVPPEPAGVGVPPGVVDGTAAAVVGVASPGVVVPSGGSVAGASVVRQAVSSPVGPGVALGDAVPRACTVVGASPSVAPGLGVGVADAVGGGSAVGVVRGVGVAAPSVAFSVTPDVVGPSPGDVLGEGDGVESVADGRGVPVSLGGAVGTAVVVALGVTVADGVEDGAVVASADRSIPMDTVEIGVGASPPESALRSSWILASVSAEKSASPPADRALMSATHPRSAPIAAWANFSEAASASVTSPPRSDTLRKRSVPRAIRSATSVDAKPGASSLLRPESVSESRDPSWSKISRTPFRVASSKPSLPSASPANGLAAAQKASCPSADPSSP